MSRKDECEVREIRAEILERGLYKISVVMELGENRSPDYELKGGDAYKLTGALTRFKDLEPGDRVTEPGVNGSETREGTILYHDTQSDRVAWHLDSGHPLISERHRLIKETQ